MSRNGRGEPSLYMVSEKRLKCVPVSEHVTRTTDYITDMEAAKKLLTPFFEQEPYEVVYIVGVDSSNRFLGFLKIEEGTVNAAPIHLRKILTFLLIEANATGLIIAHNHPGGSDLPSGEDTALTRKLTQRLKDIEVRLLDHLIYLPSGFGKKSQWISLKQTGHVPA